MMWAELVSPTQLAAAEHVSRAAKQNRGRQAPQFPSLRGENSHRGSQTGGPTISPPPKLTGCKARTHARSKRYSAIKLPRQTCCLHQLVTSRSQLTGCETLTTWQRSTATSQCLLHAMMDGAWFRLVLSHARTGKASRVEDGNWRLPTCFLQLLQSLTRTI